MRAARRTAGSRRLLTVAGFGAAAGLGGTPAGASLQEAPDGIEGRWAGAISILGTELPFSVTFATADGALGATMDIPSQNAFGLELVNVSRDGSVVHFELDAPIGLATWEGTREGDAVEGEFTQGGARGTFAMARAEEAEEDGAESEPVPYREEEISFENGEVHLEGTLTLPETPGPHPAVVLITGSGPQNRDEELVGFRPFRVIADHVTREGIAVLRYDDRGVGGSTGSVAQSTTEDFAGDALAAIVRLAAHPEIDAGRIGLLGHSEGGVVAPMAAARSESVAFVVLLAGTSVPGMEVIYEQSALIARAQGASEADIAAQTDFQRRLFAALEAGEDLAPYREELRGMIEDGIAMLPEAQRGMIADADAYAETQVKQQIDALGTPWFRYFLGYDPAGALRETEVPVLALFGELDLQVSPAQNRGPMEEALSGNPDATVEVLEGANHLFQAATTGSPLEYGSLDKAFVPGFLDRISDWILVRFGG